ncbi:MAG: hypothetical protein HKM05_04175 [Spirochaetales bacterium]|nr:hypothetical protein [Spirochaetales bacterium]
MTEVQTPSQIQQWETKINQHLRQSLTVTVVTLAMVSLTLSLWPAYSLVSLMLLVGVFLGKLTKDLKILLKYGPFMKPLMQGPLPLPLQRFVEETLLKKITVALVTGLWGTAAVWLCLVR